MFIAKAHPDEDVSELVLADVEFQDCEVFRLGYDAGDTPAGRMYIYSEFDENFQLSEQLIYEILKPRNRGFLVYLFKWIYSACILLKLTYSLMGLR